jgi:uncharacterized metal-binding protein
MSCIAGLGGDVPSLVRLAQSGRPIVAVDGCALVCVAATLRRHDLTADRHVVLSEHGVRKRKKTDFEVTEADRVLDLVRELTESLADHCPATECEIPTSMATG